MLFNYKQYVLCLAAFAWGSLTVTSYIAGDFPFSTLVFFVATLIAGIKVCVSYVVAMVGLYIEQDSLSFSIAHP